jgi:hypothetical protein
MGTKVGVMKVEAEKIRSEDNLWLKLKNVTIGILVLMYTLVALSYMRTYIFGGHSLFFGTQGPSNIWKDVNNFIKIIAGASIVTAPQLLYHLYQLARRIQCHRSARAGSQ